MNAHVIFTVKRDAFDGGAAYSGQRAEVVRGPVSWDLTRGSEIRFADGFVTYAFPEELEAADV
jgi:hypothetical protein